MDIWALLDELQTIARNGLHFSNNPYDRERYQRLMQVASQSYSTQLDQPQDQIRERFLLELGYITPKVGADAAIFNPQGEILLMDRADGGGWCLPCGWVEPNERPVDAVVREVREETGLDVQIKQLVGVFTRFPSATNGPHTMIAVVHLCEAVGGKLELSHEGLGLQYWEIDEVPRWHATHQSYAVAAQRMWRAQSQLPAVSD